MAIHIKRYPRTRSSKAVCQEKFACDGELSEAQFQCDVCRTLQCASCESKLHLQTRFVFHDRKPITKVAPELLCQQVSCVDKNYADVTCTECSLNFCAPCFDRVHSNSRKKSHRKTKFKLEITKEPVSSPSNIFSSEEFSDALNQIEAILPTCPIGIGTNDSLTYFSMPQSPENSMQHKVHHVTSSDPNFHSARSAMSSSPPRDVDLFAEDPSFQDEVEPVHIPFASKVTQPTTNFDKGTESSGSSGNEDSEPESLRQSSLQVDDDIFQNCKSFPFADQSENIIVGDAEEFIQLLQCDRDDLVKVVSIFGNTGDGKSHTLNHTFFGGSEVFVTSPSPQSCTTGVWVAFDAVHSAIIIDTEGLLGVSPNHNQRTRLLLKVLAISDIVIYRTRAERLHNDLFQFLADASKAYGKHFTEELKAACLRNCINLPVSTLGPTVLVFHETRHTEVLGKNSRESADELLQKRFQDLELSVDAFSSVHYIGTQTTEAHTDFRGLLLAVKSKLNDTSVRSPRKPSVIYQALEVLNDKFSGEIEKSLPETFPDQYFTCRIQCLSCSAKCSERVNHIQDEVLHFSSSRCSFRHEYENKVYLCKTCFMRGHEVLVVPKTSSSSESSWLGIATYAWSGYVLECPQCGVIYRSRQYWYGNQDPDKNVVQTEIRHVWPGSNPVLQGTHNAARRLLDGFHYMSDTIASVGAKPTKMVTKWLTDQIAPPYWVPNSQIQNCYSCEKKLDESNDIHHCRSCGQGFCDDCSSNQKRVPERGWGEMLVRVCDQCFADVETMTDSTDSNSDPKQLMPRRVGEVIGNTVGTVASLVNYPLDVLRDSARPQYWTPDTEITECCVCSSPFGPKLRIHHCRCCGQGVCSPCSGHERKVSSRGWDYPVRICDKCNRKPHQL